MRHVLNVFTKPTRRSAAVRYGTAIASVLLATVISLVVRPITHAPSAPLFVAAVILSAWFGGMAAGVVGTALAVVALDVVMSPTKYSFVLNEDVVARLGVFMLVAVFISALDATRRHADAERGAALERERAARADAEAANQAKDEFVTMVAHELRTPLTAAATWCAALRRGVLDADKRAHGLDVIERSVALQARIIDDLVDLSRVARGRVSVRVEPVDLRVVIEAAAEAMMATASARGIKLAMQLMPDCPPVAGDAARLQQVILNLLTNAIRHSEPGSTVSVDLDVVGDFARIDVVDEGCGIAPEFLPHVFEPYRQAEGASAAAGLGLGLTIVCRLVELHGGRVEATSPGVGQGARFTVLLPTER